MGKCESRCRNDSGPTDFEDVEYTAPVHMTFKYGEEWVKAHDMKTLFMAMEKVKKSGIKYKVLAGNTGAGKLSLFAFREEIVAKISVI